MKNNRKKTWLAVVVLLLILLVISVSYAFINLRLSGEKKQVLNAGELSLELEEDENNIRLENTLPIYDEVGMIQSPFTFRVINNSSVPLNYIVRLVDITTGERLDTSIVKYGLTKDEVDTIDFLSNLENGQVDNGVILAKQTIHYALRLWIDSSVEDETLIKNKSLSYKVGIEASQLDGTEHNLLFDANGGQLTTVSKSVMIGEVYGDLPIPTKTDSKFLGWYTERENGEKIENTSIVEFREQQVLYAHWKDPYIDNTGASRPVLKDELIPVTIASNGTVKRADITEKWYDYNNQEWANAIILLDKTKNYSEGQVIPESNIESYFVWIPRYKYKIFNTGNYSGLSSSLNANATQPIEIQFEDKTVTSSNGSTVGSWLSHPAFQAFDSNGFWVGKFESGYKGATATTEAEVNSNDTTKLQIKPNAYSWRSMILGNMFKVSYDYKRNLESHMMKNTEWGAVAYLSHSKYGKQDSTDKNIEVYINNNSNFITGCGGDSAIESENASCKNAYGSKSNNIYNQSTTGNITGVFDMSGGALEYVMGNNGKNAGKSEITTIYSDFFSNEKWSRYYDLYSSSSNTSYSSRILGDATGELGPFAYVSDYNRSSWYSSYASFVYNSYPWFPRGGHYNSTSLASVFQFGSNTGELYPRISFRVVFTPTN